MSVQIAKKLNILLVGKKVDCNALELVIFKRFVEILHAKLELETKEVKGSEFIHVFTLV